MGAVRVSPPKPANVLPLASTRMSAGRLTSTLPLLVERDLDTGLGERELDALGARREHHAHAVLVHHGRAGSADPHRRAAAPRRELALEVLDLLQIEDLAAGVHLRYTEIDDAQPLHREGVLLAAIFEDTVAPADADPEGDRRALDRDFSGRRVLGPGGAPRAQQPHDGDQR